MSIPAFGADAIALTGRALSLRALVDPRLRDFAATARVSEPKR